MANAATVTDRGDFMVLGGGMGDLNTPDDPGGFFTIDIGKVLGMGRITRHQYVFHVFPRTHFSYAAS